MWKVGLCEREVARPRTGLFTVTDKRWAPVRPGQRSWLGRQTLLYQKTSGSLWALITDRTNSELKTKPEGAQNTARLVDCLPSVHEDLGLSPSTS